MLLVSVLAAVSGCSSDIPEMVRVQGKVTFAGGDWPKPGIVFFTAQQPAEGFPRKSGSAHFDIDGNFVAKTGEFPGLIPGEYRITISCWQKPPSEGFPGLSYLSDKFTSGEKSGLTLKISPGERGPVVWNHDFPRRTK